MSFDFEKWLDEGYGTGEYTAERTAREYVREFRPLIEAALGYLNEGRRGPLEQALRDLGVLDE